MSLASSSKHFQFNGAKLETFPCWMNKDRFYSIIFCCVLMYFSFFQPDLAGPALLWVHGAASEVRSPPETVRAVELFAPTFTLYSQIRGRCVNYHNRAALCRRVFKALITLP